MSQKRIYQSELPYFITTNVKDGGWIFQDRIHAEALHGMILRACSIHGFLLIAFSILPNHFHLLVEPPLWEEGRFRTSCIPLNETSRGMFLDVLSGKRVSMSVSSPTTHISPMLFRTFFTITKSWSCPSDLARIPTCTNQKRHSGAFKSYDFFKINRSSATATPFSFCDGTTQSAARSTGIGAFLTAMPSPTLRSIEISL